MLTLADRGRRRAQRFDLAKRCELGIGVRCNCRCRGERHGARRVDFEREPLGLADLPEDDPHYVPITRHPKTIAGAPARKGNANGR